MALGVRCGDAERHRPKNGAIINQRTGPLSDHVHTGSCNCSGQNDVTGLPPDPEKPLPELVSPHQTAIGVFSRGLKRLVLAEELLSTRAYAALIIIGQKPNSHRYQYKYKSGLPRLSGFISSRYWLCHVRKRLPTRIWGLRKHQKKGGDTVPVTNPDGGHQYYANELGQATTFLYFVQRQPHLTGSGRCR